MYSLSIRLRRSLLVVILLVLASSSYAQSRSPESPSYIAALTHIDRLRATGKFETGLSRTDSLLEKHPQIVDLHIRKSLLLSDLGKAASTDEHARDRFYEALRAADRALEIDTTSGWAHVVKALAEGRLTLHVGTSERVRRSRAVKRHTDRAIQLDSTLAPAYHLRGRWHREVGTLNFLKRALVKAFYGGLPDASLEQAVHDFRRAIELESKPYNHLELGKTYREMDRPELAHTQFQAVLKTSGSPFDAEYKREARSLLAEMD